MAKFGLKKPIGLAPQTMKLKNKRYNYMLRQAKTGIA
jgi:hypothetical protein